MSAASDWWVLLHGTPLSPAVWDGVAAHLGHCGHVLCPAVTPAGDARDAPAELAARLGSAGSGLPERMHLVGHSFGGQVALDLALLAPLRVQPVIALAEHCRWHKDNLSSERDSGSSSVSAQISRVKLVTFCTRSGVFQNIKQRDRLSKFVPKMLQTPTLRFLTFPGSVPSRG